MEYYIFIWLLLPLNIFSFFTFGIDKINAIRHKRRIREFFLLLAGFLGSFGAILGMLLFRHKIRKPKFYQTIPSFAVLQGILLCYIVYVH